MAIKGLPPKVELPRVVFMTRFMLHPDKLLDRAYRDHGDFFHFVTPLERTMCVTANPETIKQVFRGDPEVFRAGESNAMLGAARRPALDPAARWRRAPAPPQAAAAALPRRADARVRRADGRGRRAPRVRVAEGRAVLGDRLDAGDHARGDPARGLRDRGRPPARPRRPSAARGARPDGEPVADAHADAGAVELGPAQPVGPLPAARARGRRGDLRGDPRAPRGSRTRPSAATSCRCCSRRATRTASRCRTRSCATSSSRCSWPGHETTATSLAWTLERITRHPEVLGEARGRSRRRVPRRGDQGVAAAAAGRAGRGAHARRAGRAGRLRAARGRLDRPVDLPDAPAPGHLSRPARVQAGAVHRQPAVELRVPAVRRRRAPLPRRELRAVRDEGRARHDPAARARERPEAARRAASRGARSPSPRPRAAVSSPAPHEPAPDTRRAAREHARVPGRRRPRRCSSAAATRRRRSTRSPRRRASRRARSTRTSRARRTSSSPRSTRTSRSGSRRSSA